MENLLKALVWHMPDFTFLFHSEEPLFFAWLQSEWYFLADKRGQLQINWISISPMQFINNSTLLASLIGKKVWAFSDLPFKIAKQKRSWKKEKICLMVPFAPAATDVILSYSVSLLKGCLGMSNEKVWALTLGGWSWMQGWLLSEKENKIDYFRKWDKKSMCLKAKRIPFLLHQYTFPFLKEKELSFSSF